MPTGPPSRSTFPLPGSPRTGSSWMATSIGASEPDRLFDALVVGAGPAGSATAALLARAGYRVAAVDRAAFPRDKPCSEYMGPEAVRLLDQLGIVESLESAGAVALHGTAVTAFRGARLHGVFALAGHRPFRSTGLSVSRSILDHALVRDSAGRRHSIRARLTIGADGLRSVVARRLGRRTHGRPRRVAFVAHVEGVEGMGDSAEMHVGARGYV